MRLVVRVVLVAIPLLVFLAAVGANMVEY